jgi:hypothetical protein
MLVMMEEEVQLGSDTFEPGVALFKLPDQLDRTTTITMLAHAKSKKQSCG